MKLRYSPASPYVRKCLVLAHEAGLAGRIDVVPTVTADPASRSREVPMCRWCSYQQTPSS